MSWITLLWSMPSALCFTLAGIYLLVPLRQRQGWERLLFSCSAAAAGVIAGLEFIATQAETGAQYGAVIRWAHLPLWVLLVSVVWFIHLYLRAGRRWLVWTICGLRTLALALNFLSKTNLNYREISHLRNFSWWGGERVSIAVGVPNPWTLVGQVGLLLLIIFLVDVTITVWRRGDHRRAILVSGTAGFFITLILGASVLVGWGLIQTPFFVSFAYLGMIAAMGYELSDDLLRAAQLARQFQASEAALRESELRMGLAASAANLALWSWNLPDDEVWITKEGRMLFGFTETERVNFDRFLRTIDGEDRDRIEKLIRASLTSGGEFESEYHIVRPSGEKRWVAGYGRVEFDERGQAVCLRGMTRNITKRKRTEEALRESEARFQIVADVAPVMIWMSGPDKLCNFFNKGWLDFTGRTLEQELGTGWTEGVHREDFEHCLRVYGEAFDARQPFTMEYRLRRNDGEYRWVLDTGTARSGADGVFLGYIGSCIDITERRQAELDHQLQTMELARVGRLALMGELMASLAHEVNNPLGAMVTNASAGQRMIARGQIGTEELHELFADIISDGHRAREVIEGIRNMVRKSEGTRSLIRINEVVRDLLRIVRADAAAKRVTLVTEVDASAGVVMGDRVQLLQVLLNLTLNAFDALSVMRVDVRLVVIRADRVNEGQICVSVRDSGPGFPAGIVDHLFEPFFTTKEEGTGMGLAIGRTIIEAHGGTLSAENGDSGGAIFTICLPEATEAKSGTA